LLPRTKRHTVIERRQAERDFTITAKEDGNDALSLEWSLKEEIRSTREILMGCYVIESTHQELTAAEILQMYMTILQVESAFRTLKSDLGLPYSSPERASYRRASIHLCFGLSFAKRHRARVAPARRHSPLIDD